jgi:hypothetical protein
VVDCASCPSLSSDALGCCSLEDILALSTTCLLLFSKCQLSVDQSTSTAERSQSATASRGRGMQPNRSPDEVGRRIRRLGERYSHLIGGGEDDVDTGRVRVG